MIGGASFFQIFCGILLPNSTPIFIVTVIYQYTNIWNDFLFGSTFAVGDQAPMTVALTASRFARPAVALRFAATEHQFSVTSQYKTAFVLLHAKSARRSPPRKRTKQFPVRFRLMAAHSHSRRRRVEG